MTTNSELFAELSDEVGTILGADFSVTTTSTKVVPHSSDGSITFPNLDAKTQACKLIDTCVLYIDIRRSTELSITHKPQTVAKLYSAFVRAMTKCARHYGGHVRGIIGDRVMVIFDCENCFTNAVDCAIIMNSTAQHVINKHFTRNEVECGIGIDSGKMLATKTGFRRRGFEQHNYRSLVWLGRPANVASKLTDIANKKRDGVDIGVLEVAYGTILGSWRWVKEYPGNFVKNLENRGAALHHKSPLYQAHIHTTEFYEKTPATPPILMTEAVFQGFKRTRPNAAEITNGWFAKVAVEVPGYTGDVYGGDVVFTVFQR